MFFKSYVYTQVYFKYFLFDTNMFEFIKFLQKRPSDKTILTSRIVFWLIYISVTYYNFIYLWKGLEMWFVSEENITIAKYVVVALWIVPLFMGISNICLLHKKYMRILQIIFSIMLFYISASIPESSELDFDIIIFLMAFFPLWAGITGKCITTTCLKYREKITKIRV